MKYLLSLLILALGMPASAQIVITKEHRVNNFGPGYCAWCSIEMVGNHNGVKRLANLTAKRTKESDVKEWDGNKWSSAPFVMVEYSAGQMVKEPRNVGTDWGIYRKLKALDVKFTQQWTGDYSTQLIKYAMKNNLAIAFAVRSGTFGQGTSAHAMVLTHYTSNKVYYVDPNDAIGRDGNLYYYVATREWFDTNWSGWLLLVER